MGVDTFRKNEKVLYLSEKTNTINFLQDDQVFVFKEIEVLKNMHK